MKKRVLILILVCISMFSCDKNLLNPKETLSVETISAKWNISSSDEYKSFEFNESGNYIIIKNESTKSTNDQVILYGTYEIINKSTIELSALGTITVNTINETEINFSIKLTGSTTEGLIINAIKQTEFENSERTEMFCRTWSLISENGESVVGTEDELTVLFSKAGTYFVVYADGGNGLSQWQWKDEAETMFYYSWEEEPVWEEADYVEIIELSSSVLKILEKHDEDQSVYVLEPVVEPKAVNLSSNAGLNKKIGKNTLFR